MKRILGSLGRDLWVALLDIVAVNVSYVLALLIRFYVNFELRPVAISTYLPSWESFTPWYSVICMVIFASFRLYGGVWRYAGIHDMNRIICASAATSLVHVVGTIALVQRMPITYYLIGGFLQFVAVALIRFGYRILLVEKKRINTWRGKRIDTLVVGVGENGRRVVLSLEESDIYRPIAVVGNGTGTIDGIPIVTLDKLPAAQAIFVADPLLPAEERRKIKDIADTNQMEFHEFTGYFSNLGGKLSVTELLAVIHVPLTLEINGKEHRYDDGEAALASLTERYSVSEIDGKALKLVLRNQKKMTAKESLAQAYAAVMDEEMQ